MFTGVTSLFVRILSDNFKSQHPRETGDLISKKNKQGHNSKEDEAIWNALLAKTVNKRLYRMLSVLVLVLVHY